VYCGVEHNLLEVAESGRSIAGFCCAAPGAPSPAVEGAPVRSTSYVDCPSWEMEKQLLAMGFKSLSDAQELEAANDRYMREDLTGSMYGSLDEFNVIEDAVQESLATFAELRERGGGVMEREDKGLGA
jgi:hypothetical protein